MVLRAQLQKYFQRKTYLCKERQKSFSIKMGLKLHRSRNLETDGFWLDALILYLRYPRCVRMLLRANCSRLWSKYSQNEEKQFNKIAIIRTFLLLNMDGFLFDDFALYLRHLWCARMLLRAQLQLILAWFCINKNILHKQKYFW